MTQHFVLCPSVCTLTSFLDHHGQDVFVIDRFLVLALKFSSPLLDVLPEEASDGCICLQVVSVHLDWDQLAYWKIDVEGTHDSRPSRIFKHDFVGQCKLGR